MDKHEYRGYEIVIQVEQLRDGRTVTDSRITPVCDEEKERMGDTRWLGSKEVHASNGPNPVERVLEASKRVIDHLIRGVD
ncbi:hypothetical protein WL05_01805 [Burkholderia ubonensis]|uniref:hypothetical protein n=1 Tax=Burkholderia ubonensis TaxID=101571 RepID=UPI00075CCECE|nr:hypothetical protein [Burkholderia ubonensis]KVX59549.1 hypothetical protein WL05_01805 [Burkholderia ubonensis]KVZ56100.1 hypothetical protein WL19_07365 [Burkholderia ubonensis]KVZ81090.1 hypothetical protein WL24_17720 [Burkholderia ubonensis]